MPSRRLFLAGSVLAAGLFLFWASSSPIFRMADGRPASFFFFTVSMVGAVLLTGMAWGSRRLPFAAGVGLALAGQAASLQLIDAGSQVLRYQHIRLAGPLTLQTTLAWAVILVQLVVMLAWLRRRGAAVAAWAGRMFRPWQILALGFVFIIPAAAFSRDLVSYGSELLVAAALQALNLATVIFAVWMAPEDLVEAFQRWFRRAFGRAGEPAGRRVDRLALAGALWTTLLAAGLAFFIYQNHPHIHDEVSYLYQARYLAAGRLTVPAPPVPEAFSFYLIPFRAENWYSIFPPGWPAVLAVGVLAGVPWLVNPLLAGLNIFLAFLLVRRLYDSHLARLAVVLLAASPWNLFMGMNFMSHTWMQTCALGAALALQQARETGRARWSGLAGICIGVLSLIRPMDAVIVGGLLALWALGLGGRRLKWTGLAACALATILTGALVLPYNQAVTGSALTLPLSAYYRDYFGPQSNALGFGPGRGLDWPLDAFPGHSPLEALLNLGLNSFSINVELFGWAAGSLLLAGIAVFAARRHKADRLVLAVIGAQVVGYSLYWYSGGPEFGARYHFLLLVPLVILTLRGAQALAERLGAQAGRLYLALAILVALAVINYLPWRAVDKYYHFIDMQPGVRQLAQEKDFGRSLVLIEGRDYPDYSSAWTYNPLDPNADAPIYAYDASQATRARLLDSYPDRPVWVIDGPTVTGGGYQVVAGPLTTDQARGWQVDGAQPDE